MSEHPVTRLTRLFGRTHYTSVTLDAPCPVCRTPLPRVLVDAGIDRHPCCGPDVAPLLARDRKRDRSVGVSP